MPTTTRPTGHDAGSHLPSLRILAALLLAAAFVQGCGTGGGGSSELAGILALVPADSENVLVYDFEQIRKEDAPGALRDEFEDLSEYGLEELGVLTDELTTLVIASGDDWYLLVVEGDIDFGEVRDQLEDGDYEDDQYRGVELWEEAAWRYEAVALFEDRGRIVIGDTDAVKSVLRMLDRGSGSLLDDADSDLGRALKRAGEGWVSSADEQCLGYELRGCRAVGVSLRRGADDYLVEATIAVLFRDERTAESGMDEVESQLEEDSSFEFDIDDVRLDGDFVIVTASGDEDDLFEGDEEDLSVRESPAPVTPTVRETRDAPARAPDTRDDHGDSADEATFVTVGDAVTGRLSDGRDVDYFAFAAERGQTYRIDVDLGTLDDSIAALYDAASRELEFDDDGGEAFGSRITWAAAESGTYYVAVSGWGGAGSYTLTVTAVHDAPARAPDARDDHGDSADEATFVTVGGAVTGVLDHAKDIDYFAFAAERGQTYRIDVDLGTLDDSVAALFDADSQRLVFDDDGGEALGSRITWTAAESGTYYVAVAGWGDTGSYTLTVTAVRDGEVTDAPASGADTPTVCRAGLVVVSGESCTYPGTTIEFSVDSSGRGRFLFFTSGRSIEIKDSTINGVVYNFVATAQRNGIWLIEAVGDSVTPPPTATSTASGSDQLPGTPANQRYEYDGSSIVLSWDASTDATSYTVYYDDFFGSSCRVRSGSPSFCEELASDLTETSYTHADPDRGDNYYWVVACNSSGCSEVDSANPAQLGGSPPETPANQRYEHDGSAVVLTWDASADATSYTVYYDDFFGSSCRVRSGSPSFCEELASDLTETSYTHADPDRDDNYYWVVACNRFGCSAVDSENPAREE